MNVNRLMLITCWIVSSTTASEYCLTETFRAECRGLNDVILMERATFGRMELGRCVTKNYGHVGCSVDVLPYMDRLCSGRRLCQLAVSDPSLVRTKPCPVDFSSYLDADYRCVRVLLPSLSGPDCPSTKEIKEYPHTLDSTYASNGQGQGFAIATDCPVLLIVRVHPGQRINVTLYDFSATQQHGDVIEWVTSASQITSAVSSAAVDMSGDEMCRWPYATITEKSVVGNEVRLCGDRGQQFQQPRRESHVYMSRTSELRLTLSGKIKRFMIKLEGI